MMNFLAPSGFFFALFLPAVILLYLLKLKRIDTPVSSTLLWRKSLEDLKANTPFQKLKRNLLLFLQLLVIALLTFSIARPILQVGGLEGQSFILLIDSSASMTAGDVQPNRLEIAKRKALELVNDMSLGDRMMIVSFASKARVLTPFEQNKGALKQIIREIKATHEQTHISDAFRVAKSALDVAVNPEIVLLSDGQFKMSPDTPLGQAKVRYVPIGVSTENVGIVDLVVRKDYSLEGRYEVLVGMQNTGLETQEVYVELWGEGYVEPAASAGMIAGGTPPASSPLPVEKKLMDARKLTMAPHTYEPILFKDPGTFPEKIEVILDSNDSLQVDNHAWAIIPQEKTINILLVTNGNFYLERVLNLDPRVRLFTTTPGKYARPEEYDIVVFDSYSPPALIGGNYLFINTVPRLPGWTWGDEISAPVIVDWNSLHPLTRYLNFDNLLINRCNNIGTPPWIEVIAESRETPLILTFQQDEIRGIVTTFDIYQSSWPKQVSFPIFFTNLVNWFQSSEGLQVFMKKTGDVLVLDPPEDLSQKGEIIPPDKEDPQEIEFAASTPVYFDQTHLCGIYEYRLADHLSKRYSINLLSPAESTIAPKETLTLQEMEIQGEKESVKSNREIWRTIAIVALIVLMIEWMVYVKRARYSF